MSECISKEKKKFVANFTRLDLLEFVCSLVDRLLITSPLDLSQFAFRLSRSIVMVVVGITRAVICRTMRDVEPVVGEVHFYLDVEYRKTGKQCLGWENDDL